MKHLMLILALLLAVPAGASVIGTEFRPDKPYPEFSHLWQEGWSLKDDDGNKLIYAKPDMPLGGYLFIYCRNTSGSAVKVTDLTMDSIRLSEGIGKTHEPSNVQDKYGSSILLSSLPEDQINRLKAAGSPVWWKAEPRELAPGDIGEIVIRLRRVPLVDRLKIGILTSAGEINAEVNVRQPHPSFTTISFSPDLTTVYLYAAHPSDATMSPSKVFLDGKDVTTSSKIASDTGQRVSPIVVNLPEPLERMSYHHFKVVYPDGSAASSGIRAWGRDIVYGMWGASQKSAATSEEAAKRYLDDWLTHNINVQMGHHSGPAHDFFTSKEGWDYCESIGIGRMTTWALADEHRPVFFFLQDEPDAHDANTRELKPADRLGSPGQWLVDWAEALRRHSPVTPILLNIDNTYKPENWYMYHQLSDIPCIDPYFPEQQDYIFSGNPGSLWAHTKPTYVYAVSAISQSAGQPKPLHVILCSTKYFNEQTGYLGRYPTPEEKRIEVYYALVAGAKGFSYWWFSPDKYCIGCGTDEPEAQALWKEIGLLGAEVRTAGEIITRSTPADLAVTAPEKLWTRTLISGTDTVALIAVNDDIACDRLGTMYKPVEEASASLIVPGWLKPADAFEVTYRGIKNVRWEKNGNRVKIDLGTVDLTRFVIVTSNTSHRMQLEKVYREQFASNVEKLMAEE